MWNYKARVAQVIAVAIFSSLTFSFFFTKRGRVEKKVDFDFIKYSTGFEISRLVKSISSFDEAEITLVKSGWTAFYFSFDVSNSDYFAKVLEAKHLNLKVTPCERSPCQWEYLSKVLPQRSESTVCGDFVGPNGNTVTTTLDVKNGLGWMCVLSGDRGQWGAPREE